MYVVARVLAPAWLVGVLGACVGTPLTPNRPIEAPWDCLEFCCPEEAPMGCQGGLVNDGGCATSEGECTEAFSGRLLTCEFEG